MSISTHPVNSLAEPREPGLPMRAPEELASFSVTPGTYVCLKIDSRSRGIVVAMIGTHATVLWSTDPTSDAIMIDKMTRQIQREIDDDILRDILNSRSP